MTPDQADLILSAYATDPIPDRLLDDVLTPAITRRKALHLAEKLIEGGWIQWHDQSQLRNLARFIQRNAQ